MNCNTTHYRANSSSVPGDPTYTGTAFLAADLAAMVIRGSIDRPQLLWVAGLALGASVVGLGAVCERRREQILQRVRAVGAVLESWR